MARKMKLGEMLVEAGLIDEVQLRSALAHQKKWGEIKLGTALVELKMISERDLVSFLEKQLNTRCVSIMTKEISPDTVKALDPEVAKKFSIFPIELSDKELIVATSNPIDLDMIDELAFSLGKRIKPQLALESDIKRAIKYYYDNIRDEGPSTSVSESLVADSIRMPSVEGERSFEPDKAGEKAVTTKLVVEAILTVLEKKGLLNREEVFDEIKKKL